ncbi:hypothetical protein FB451DRAFT_581400 [Mycena latifolia]|nr:hypothetical protein FB451DRAFT_581400 [Mycena latifolia]
MAVELRFPVSRSASSDPLTYGKCRSMTTTARIPFPALAHGFLYYRPERKSAPLEGDIRFRIAPDDLPSSFTGGEDLHGPLGFPWRITLPQVTCRNGYAWISHQLVH